MKSQLKHWHSERKIRAALQDATKLEFIETPLQDVIEYLEDRHAIQIEMDTRALDLVGIGSDTPINRDLNGVSLENALSLMLRDLELTYLIRHGVLLITTPEVEKAEGSIQIFSVADLATDAEAKKELVGAVRVAIGFEENEIATFGNHLIVRGTSVQFQRTAELLFALRGSTDVHPLARMSLGTKINLSSWITDDDLRYLPLQKQIKWLDVSKSRVSDKGLAMISKLPELETLILSGTYVTDASVARLRDLKSLKVLDLTDTMVTNAGVEKLAAMKSLRHLTVGCGQRNRSKISKAAVESLRKSLPECQITAFFFQPNPMDLKPKPRARKAAATNPFGDPFGGGADPFRDSKPAPRKDPFGIKE